MRGGCISLGGRCVDGGGEKGRDGEASGGDLARPPLLERAGDRKTQRPTGVLT